jgi:hypothetical protein
MQRPHRLRVVPLPRPRHAPGRLRPRLRRGLEVRRGLGDGHRRRLAGDHRATRRRDRGPRQRHQVGRTRPRPQGRPEPRRAPGAAGLRLPGLQRRRRRDRRRLRGRLRRRPERQRLLRPRGPDPLLLRRRRRRRQRLRRRHRGLELRRRQQRPGGRGPLRPRHRRGQRRGGRGQQRVRVPGLRALLPLRAVEGRRQLRRHRPGLRPGGGLRGGPARLGDLRGARRREPFGLGPGRRRLRVPERHPRHRERSRRGEPAPQLPGGVRTHDLGELGPQRRRHAPRRDGQRIRRPERLHQLRRPRLGGDPVGLVLVGGDLAGWRAHGAPDRPREEPDRPGPVPALSRPGDAVLGGGGPPAPAPLGARRGPLREPGSRGDRRGGAPRRPALVPQPGPGVRVEPLSHPGRLGPVHGLGPARRADAPVPGHAHDDAAGSRPLGQHPVVRADRPGANPQRRRGRQRARCTGGQPVRLRGLGGLRGPADELHDGRDGLGERRAPRPEGAGELEPGGDRRRLRLRPVGDRDEPRRPRGDAAPACHRHPRQRRRGPPHGGDPPRPERALRPPPLRGLGREQPGPRRREPGRRPGHRRGGRRRRDPRPRRGHRRGPSGLPGLDRSHCGPPLSRLRERRGSGAPRGGDRSGGRRRPRWRREGRDRGAGCRGPSLRVRRPRPRAARLPGAHRPGVLGPCQPQPAERHRSGTGERPHPRRPGSSGHRAPPRDRALGPRRPPLRLARRRQPGGGLPGAARRPG